MNYVGVTCVNGSCPNALANYLTKEMIEALLNGKCIAGDNGEYVTFIEME